MADPDERTAAERIDATRQAAWSLIRRCALDGGDLRIGLPATLAEGTVDAILAEFTAPR